MDNRLITYIMTGAAGAVFVGIICWIPFRIKQMKKESGALLMTLKSDFPMKAIAVFFVSAALIAIVPVRNFALYLSAVFFATALIAAWMSAKEVANSGMNGIFENMLISDTTAIRYDEILSLPTVAYEKDEDTTQVDFSVLEILLHTGSKVQMIFPDEATRNQALEIILKQCPRLAE